MVKEVVAEDVERALDLVNRVFSEFVAVDYAEQGKSTFESYLKSKLREVSASLASGDKKMWAYYQGDEILGVIATQGISHISLLFVEKAYHRQGIARQLFDVVREELRRHEHVTQMTVNSSPYALETYARLGFTKTGERQEKDGIIFIPMMRPL